ncbi:hypothetical protein [Dactylosporangium sp. NPDC000521]|uniref:hypothetical protein n=1 Tax=Dactylosporangium sp. NPDC000521 TaxID=3363975 RepID=UPI0036B751B9
MSDPSQPLPQQPSYPPGAPSPLPPQQVYEQPQFVQPQQPQFAQPQQPQYGQTPYGQPQYGQPQQAQYGQPQPQYGPAQYHHPQWTPPPAKNRTALIVSIVAGVVVLLFAAAVTVAYSLTRDDEPAATASAASTAGGSGEKRLRLTAPAAVGPWKKATSQELAGKMSAAGTVGLIDEPFAAQYDNGGLTAVLWGGTGKDIRYDSAQELFTAFVKAALTITPGTPGTTTPVDPGMIGGQAYCVPIKSSGASSSACLWYADQLVVGFVFTGGEPDAAGPAVKEMLSGLVVFG